MKQLYGHEGIKPSYGVVFLISLIAGFCLLAVHSGYFSFSSYAFNFWHYAPVIDGEERTTPVSSLLTMIQPDLTTPSPASSNTSNVTKGQLLPSDPQKSSSVQNTSGLPLPETSTTPKTTHAETLGSQETPTKGPFTYHPVTTKYPGNDQSSEGSSAGSHYQSTKVPPLSQDHSKQPHAGLHEHDAPATEGEGRESPVSSLPTVIQPDLKPHTPSSQSPASSSASKITKGLSSYPWKSSSVKNTSDLPLPSRVQSDESSSAAADRLDLPPPRQDNTEMTSSTSRAKTSPSSAESGATSSVSGADQEESLGRNGAPVNMGRNGAPVNMGRNGAPVNMQRNGAPVNMQRNGAPVNMGRNGAPVNSHSVKTQTSTAPSTTNQQTSTKGPSTYHPDTTKYPGKTESSEGSSDVSHQLSTSVPPLSQVHSKQPQTGIKEPLTVDAGRGFVDSYTYPTWWAESWPRSAVWENRAMFVGDQPFFPSCLTTNDTWEAFQFVEPEQYVDNSKNPCWYDRPAMHRGLHCVPYFYLAGVAKGGTTDLSRRIRLHPQVFEGTRKEYHWWERYRFGNYDEEDLEEDELDTEGGRTFEEYTEKITGTKLEDLEDELKDIGSSERIFGDCSPSYLWDPQNWYVLEGNQNCSEPRIIVGQHIRHVFPQAKVILTFRHPTPRLYSRFVSRTARTSHLRKATPEEFHAYVLEGIGLYRRCFAQFSVRQCAYDVALYRESVVRLVEGMYPVFMADWLRVWPRDSILLLRYEDYGGQEERRLAEIFDFLGLDPLDDVSMKDLVSFDAINSGSDNYQRLGAMLNETKAALDDFYQPFIHHLAHLLHDPRFLWNDVTH